MKRVSKQLKQKTSLNPKRYFSIEIKKKTVKDIESGKCTVREASRELLVSENSIYIWLNKFSRYLKSNKRLIVEEKSESYRSKELEMKIKDLEAALGRKQLEVDYLNKLIDVAEQKLNLDIKKILQRSARMVQEQQRAEALLQNEKSFSSCRDK